MSGKLRLEQIADFVDRWKSEDAARFEVLLINGQRTVIQDCYLSRDQAGRPDRIWVNHDSPGQSAIDFDPDEVVSITDLDQQYDVIRGPE